MTSTVLWDQEQAVKFWENFKVSVSEPVVQVPASRPAAPVVARPRRSRPLLKRITQLIRRSHLYFGLFLIPWVILYGFTGYLFNHAFSFRPTKNAVFRSDKLVGTPLEKRQTPTEQANLVIAQLNEQQQPEHPYKLVGEATYGPRGTAFVTAKYKDLPDKLLSVSFNLTHSGGGVHYEGNREPKPVPPAPFRAGPPVSAGRFGGRGGEGGGERGRRGDRDSNNGAKAAIKLEDRLEDRVLATVPMILERTGFPPVDSMVVTSLPNLMFTIDSNGELWKATYNPMSGGINGIPVGSEEKPEMGWRRFLTQLHLAHIYPYEKNARWVWALLVDTMAVTMIFWAFSGIIMWWQIKSTRKLGTIVLTLSLISTVALGWAMYATMTS